jgi:hypothetical protein
LISDCLQWSILLRSQLAAWTRREIHLRVFQLSQSLLTVVGGSVGVKWEEGEPGSHPQAGWGGQSEAWFHEVMIIADTSWAWCEPGPSKCSLCVLSCTFPVSPEADAVSLSSGWGNTGTQKWNNSPHLSPYRVPELGFEPKPAVLHVGAGDTQSWHCTDLGLNYLGMGSLIDYKVSGGHFLLRTLTWEGLRWLSVNPGGSAWSCVGTLWLLWLGDRQEGT